MARVHSADDAIDAEMEALRREKEALLNDDFDDETGERDESNRNRHGTYSHEYADTHHRAAKQIQKMHRGSSVRKQGARHHGHHGHGHRHHGHGGHHHGHGHHGGHHSSKHHDAAKHIQRMHRGSSARRDMKRRRAGGSMNPLHRSRSGHLVSARGTRQRWYKSLLDREFERMEQKRGRESSYTTGDDELFSACPDCCRLIALTPCMCLAYCCPDPKPKGGWDDSDDDEPGGCCSCLNCCGVCDCCGSCCRKAGANGPAGPPAGGPPGPMSMAR